jgi:NAD(P)-dependent dehydrogenase (short-subunit alcohol dehydrogenase family)
MTHLYRSVTLRIMNKGAVFVTGASSGIGRATVERLAADGFTVVAGVRRDTDAPPAASAHVLIDLAETDSVVTAAKDLLEQTGGALAGLVNNAGINVNGPFEVLPIEEWRRQFEVNLFGQLSLTRELLPALLGSRGRIVTVGSVGGRYSAPFLGPYSASKFAVRAWMDALRHELDPHGVKAVLVEPGAIDTPIWNKGNAHADTVLDGMSDEQKQRYAGQVAGARKLAAMAERNAIPPEKVAAVVARALVSRNPRGRYLVGVDARLQAVIAASPTRAADWVTRRLVGAPKRSW